MLKPQFLATLSLMLLFCAAALPAQDAPDDIHISRVNALELAHAFSDEGYIVRDGFWRTELKPGEEKICGLQLFAGVDYWICLGTGTDAQVEMALFSSGARQVPVHERVRERSRAAIRVRPLRSGTFYLKVRSVSGTPGRVCVTYCYK